MAGVNFGSTSFSSSQLNKGALGNRIVWVGTSLIQHGQDFASTKNSYSARSAVTWTNILLKQRAFFQVWYDAAAPLVAFRGSNKGVSGQYTSEILARIDAVIAIKPDIVILDCGTNDMAGRPDISDPNNIISVVWGETQQIVNRLRSAGIFVVLLSILPRATSVSSYNSGAAARKRARWMNELRRRYAQITPDVVYCDWGKFWTDAASADGAPVAAYTDDGIHQTPDGGYWSALPIVELLDTLIRPLASAYVGADDVYDATNNPLGNIAPAGLLVGTGGTVGTGIAAGSVATGWRVEFTPDAAVTGLTITPSKVARTDQPGEWQRIVMASSGGGSNNAAQLLFRTATATITSPALPANDWLIAECDIKVSSLTGQFIKTIMLRLQDINTNGFTAESPSEYTGFYFPQVATWDGRYQTGPIKLPGGASGYRIRVQATLDSTKTGSATVDIGNISLRRADDPTIVFNGG